MDSTKTTVFGADGESVEAIINPITGRKNPSQKNELYVRPLAAAAFPVRCPIRIQKPKAATQSQNVDADDGSSQFPPYVAHDNAAPEDLAFSKLELVLLIKYRTNPSPINAGPRNSRTFESSGLSVVLSDMPPILSEKKQKIA